MSTASDVPPFCVEVAVPVPVYQTYHYLVPSHLSARVQAGCRVLVPFGPRLQTGIVLQEQVPAEVDRSRLKPILEALDAGPLITSEMLQLARWVAQHYLAPPGETLRAFLPPGLEVASVMMVQLTPLGLDALRFDGEALTPQRRAVLELIHSRGTTTTRFIQKTLRLKSIYSLLSHLQSQSWIEVFQKKKAARVREKRAQAVLLTEAGRERLEGGRAGGESDVRVTDKQWAALQSLGEFRPPVLASFLRRQAGTTAATLKALAGRGLLEIREIAVRRTPFQDEPGPPLAAHELTDEQQAVLQAIADDLDAARGGAVLLHGVTGSGKTEVYIRAAKRVLASGGQVLVLVPEIGLTPAAMQVFRSHFRDQVALLHSGLGAGERRDEWFRVRRGEASVVVGTRSAVFAPLQNPKLFIIDEEHDGSYKQDETPRYHARDVALQRAQAHDALVLLGSATPAVETYHRATAGDGMRYLRMSKRVLDRPLAAAEIVDMQEEFLRHGPGHILSTRLRAAIDERLRLGEQVLLLLNRRGFAPALLCRSCGFVLRCDECSTAMTYHRTESTMLCHHCSRVKKVPVSCPECRAHYIFYVGEGTEKLQAEIQKAFPDVRVDRMDSDTTLRKGSYFKILRAFARGQTRILIGTQMIAKGHDFPNVTLAGVVGADQALAVPDFRAAERTFQLLTQVAGRSGRGVLPGEVIVQTRFPNHYSLRFACRQDYEGFYAQEVEYRRTMAYPPFTCVANLVVRGPTLKEVTAAARSVSDLLKEVRREEGLESEIRILGPNPAPLERLKGGYRYQILLKSIRRESLRRLLEQMLQRSSGSRGGKTLLTVDLDPMNLL